MIDAKRAAEVERLIRTVAEHEILPRFGRLSAGDISEKSPGDLVTVADRAAEEALTAGLTALLPGSAVVGEEAVAADPAVVERLAGPDPVWVVDPIDGTYNFVAGSPRFATMVALAREGELLASWIHAPRSGLMATATAGGGAYVDGRRVRVSPAPGGLRGLEVRVSHPHWWTAEQRERFDALRASGAVLSYLDCAGLEYVDLATGRHSAMVLTWEYPWDHAAGLLLFAEAGGTATVRDGAPFRLAGGNPLPFVAAPDPRTAALLHTALTPEPS